MKKVTIDSSVIIASLLKNELRHKEAATIWQKVLTGKQVAIMPYSILVEVVAAIKRRTGSRELAIEIKKELMSIDSLSFVVLDNESAEHAADIAARVGIRGMDAIVIQVAEEYKTDLISFDTEMVKKYQLVPKNPE
jgi:predicted nucleic acid-binding protein